MSTTATKTIFGVSVLAVIVISLALFWHANDDPGTPAQATVPVPTSAPTQPLDEHIALAETQLKKTQTSYDDLLRERNQLAHTNVALADARLKSEKDKARAEQTSELMTGIASKLADDGQLQVPQTVAEAAVFAGQLHRTATDFTAKWGSEAPPEGTPESAAYHKEMDALTTDFAALMKSFGANSLESIAKAPSSIAQFQGLQLYGALQLSDTQWQQLDGALNRYFTEGFARKLDGAARPATGVDAWEQQRTALSQRAFTEIQAMLTPQQRADFDRLYNSSFLWNFNIGGK